jgi:hypothetical protein
MNVSLTAELEQLVNEKAAYIYRSACQVSACVSSYPLA